MGRIRTIKPEFPQSESMGRVSRDARLLFVMMWTLVDDSGRTRAASRMLASLLFPYDDDAAKLIDGWLEELESEGCIVRYVVKGDTFLQVCKWREHQKIDRPSESKFPPFDEASRILASPRERSSLDLDQGPRTKDQGKDQPTEVVSDRFDEFWSAFDKKVARPHAERAWRRIAPDDVLAAAIIARARAYAAATPDKQYRAHPATWLNRRGWEDELPAKGKTASVHHFSEVDYGQTGAL